MISLITVLSILFTFSFLFLIIKLILKGKLREEYAVFWFLLATFLLVFVFWRKGIDVIAEKAGVYYAPSFLFMGAIFLILLYLLHLSVVNTKLSQKVKKLAQEIALQNSKKVKDQNE